MDKFWTRVDRRGSEDCWPWLGGRDRSGYGQFKHEGGSYKAHRVAYALTHDGFAWSTGQQGSKGLIVLHSCDNRACCNPAHLRVGGQADNVRDAVAKHRMAHGVSHRLAKLTPAQVAQIRALGAAGLIGARGRGWHRDVPVGHMSYRQAGEMFGVGGKTIEQLLRGRSWRHVK